ncbi:hypothetical protein QYE76_049764 [Lolium multiflorum]|uniref:Pentatricopeptide repeat-containing protein n=1 Tax=Lolium multiflorum TaxID=4521 RepID=A0AAD8SPS3_LOLMU|nr:hypothetical protein QYE76_049764 [Lolium multiflorum]
MTATARKVFDDMARAGVAVDTHVCNDMLHVRLKVGDAARAKALMTRMDAAGMPLDGFSFNTVIMLYIRKSRWGARVSRRTSVTVIIFELSA